VKANFKLLIPFFSLFCFAATAQTAHHPATHQTSKTKIEGMVLDRIYALPEVTTFFRKYKKEKPIMMDEEPNASCKYYFVQVGISNLDQFRSSYSFYIDPKTFKIYYWDTMDDSGDNPISLITLQQWRYWRHDPRFNEMHTFRHGKLVVLKE
jgi:hypothetical protein